jgi:pimeloyl-ACP methyl ester carboxylesterase
MQAPTRTQVADFRGAARLAFEATVGITDLVETMHRTIQLTPLPLGRSRAGATRGITGLVYRSVRGMTRLISRGVDAGLSPFTALLPEGESTRGRDALVSIVNGVYGDHLERTGNPLAIEMQLRCDGARIDPTSPAAVAPEATGRVMLIVHGLCLNESHWVREGTSPIDRLATARGYTPVYLRYNTGRAIADNGRSLADLLEALLGNWPRPVSEFAIVGHSMGGLVARSAIHHAKLARHQWPAALKRLVFIGTPLHGSPLERGGHRLDYVMDLSPYVAPFTRIGKARSAGIMDLRHGNIADDQQAFIPLPENVDCYTLAATLGSKRDLVSERLVGDGLVPLDSAIGRHRDPARTFAIPAAQQWVGHGMGHMELLHRPELYAQLGEWLGRGGPRTRTRRQLPDSAS